ncbi:Hypothetical predicted protein, partial [Paramuricea clavata]
YKYFWLPDGEKQIIPALSLRDPPSPEPKKSNRQERRHRRDKPSSIKQTPTLEEDDEPTATSSFVECEMDEVPHLFVLRINDGLMLQVGNIVKVENFVGPLMIVDLSHKHNELLAKLCLFNIVLSKMFEGFVSNRLWVHLGRTLS